jgi:hypothetical protein
MVSIESSFQPSGKLVCVDVLAGDVGLARFELMLPAAMPSWICSSQYLPLLALPLRPGRWQISHGAVGAIAESSSAQQTCRTHARSRSELSA